MNLYTVLDADYQNGAYPDVLEINAVDPTQAGKEWAKQNWACYGYPDGMECIVIEVSTQRRHRVGISVEAEPVFYASSREVV